MSKKLSKLEIISDSSVTSAEQFLDKIRGLSLDENEMMLSFDVTSLFTSIPQNLAEETIRRVLETRYNETDSTLKISHLIEMLRFCLNTIFTFDGKTYKQQKGTPMGSSISGIIAEAVLMRLETEAFQRYRPRLWLRYVDDTFVVIERNMKEQFLDIINDVFPDIKFTMEEEADNKIAFLDVMIERKSDGDLETSVYRKATTTTQMLHFKSNHPVAHKRSCVNTLFRRADTHCSTAGSKIEEINYLYRLFYSNGYTRSFINKCRRKRNQVNAASETEPIRRSLPFITDVSHATSRILRPYGIEIAHRPSSTLRTRIMQPKDKLRDEEKSSIIYDIKCNDCPKHYVGESSKKLKTRIHEHELCVRRKDVLSLVAQHTLENNHTFDFAGAKVVGMAKNRSSRQLKEAWLSDDNSINRHVNLDSAYQSLRFQASLNKPSTSRQFSSRIMDEIPVNIINSEQFTELNNPIESPLCENLSSRNINFLHMTTEDLFNLTNSENAGAKKNYIESWQLR
jgi:hypothetical protein